MPNANSQLKESLVCQSFPKHVLRRLWTFRKLSDTIYNIKVQETKGSRHRRQVKAGANTPESKQLHNSAGTPQAGNKKVDIYITHLSLKKIKREHFWSNLNSHTCYLLAPWEWGKGHLCVVWPQYGLKIQPISLHQATEQLRRQYHPGVVWCSWTKWADCIVKDPFIYLFFWREGWVAEGNGNWTQELMYRRSTESQP